MRFGATLMLLLSLLLNPGRTRAQDAPPSEYQVKAAFIFNFAKFVEWPAEAFTNASSPMVIGVLGDNPFGNDLSRTIQGKTINEHPLQVRAVPLTEATNCHILFISSSEKKRLREIVGGLGHAAVLTVSETDGFTEAGGMINFVNVSNRIRFQINEPAARKSKLKVSSKLLSLAVPSAR